mgnify:CR=1 FL=1
MIKGRYFFPPSIIGNSFKTKNKNEIIKFGGDSPVRKVSQTKLLIKTNDEELINLKQEIIRLEKLNEEVTEKLHKINENIDEVKQNRDILQKENENLKTQLESKDKELENVKKVFSLCAYLG